jgi:EAL domain-containing protein (putative c-di-GMP-specific phosphodiesterase class I)
MFELIAPVRIGTHEVPLSASAGIAVYPDHGSDPKELIAHADAAVLEAKRQGAGALQFYSSAMSDAAYHAIVMEQELHEATQSNQFVVFYQPQVNSADGKLIGLEALLRWQHPRRGLLMPAQFLPLAEERQLMKLIGDWVLNSVATTLSHWRSEGMKIVPISINLSSQQFEARDFIPKLTAVLKRYDISAGWLELELTERMLMEEVSLVREHLAQLRALGVRVAVDDFGTGFSSLAHLKQYALDRLKIDQSFVRDLPDAADSVAITKAIVQMAHSLGISVIAEGVESEVQRQFLVSVGCDQQQGYLFGKAVPAAQIDILLRGI